jgi:hypothetical protein
MPVFGTLVNSDASGATGVRNMLINGDFRVWQKGTDLNTATTGAGVTSVDRWTSHYADFTPRIRKVEDTLTTGETVDTAEITKISGDNTSCEFSQKIETTVAKYLRGRTVTFSFWIKKVGATLGTHNFDCWIGDSETENDTGWTNQRTVDRSRATRQTGVSGAVTFTNTDWRKITITRTLTSDTNTIYCTIYTSNTPTNQGIRIANCQLELGSVATSFERRPYAMEFAMCQRYFWRLSNAAHGDPNLFGIATSLSNNSDVIFYPTPSAVPMRANPTVTTSAANTFGTWPGASGGGQVLGSSFYSVGPVTSTTSSGVAPFVEFMLGLASSPGTAVNRFGFRSSSGFIQANAEF